MAQALIIASTVISVIGSLQQASATASADKFNAAMANRNAQEVTQEGIIAEQKQRQDNARRQGDMRANIGASGLDSSGTPLDLLQESAYNGEINALTTRYNYNTKAEDYRLNAQMDSSKASSDMTAGYLNAAGSLVSGGAQYYKYSSTGTAITTN